MLARLHQYAVLSEPSLVYTGTIFHELAQRIIRDSMNREKYVVCFLYQPCSSKSEVK